MSQKQNNSPSDLLNWIPVLILGALIFVVQGALLLFAYLLKKPLLRLFDIEDWSDSWIRMKWLYIPLLWISGIVASFLLFSTALALIFAPDWKSHIAQIFTSALISLVCIFIYATLYWMQAFASDPEVRRRSAGKKAEKYVMQLINANLHRYPDAASMHGPLFVFNEGKDDEYSIEADHVLVTQHHAYVIETKYKSGRVQAVADAIAWQTANERGQGSMRNALAQAKNSAKFLERECGLPNSCIPLVAIYGKDTEIVDGPSNVAVASEIIKVIDAFEMAATGARIHPTQIIDKLTQFETKDKAAFERHITRAARAGAKAERETIVRNASR